MEQYELIQSIKYFEKRLLSENLFYGEKQSIHTALKLLREKQRKENIKVETYNGCKLCNSNEIQEDGRKIIKKHNFYILEKWEPKGYEFDYTYSKFGETNITHCPECNRKLGD
jgi:hypothetical protein